LEKMSKEIENKEVAPKVQSDIKIKPSDNTDKNKADSIFDKIKDIFDVKKEEVAQVVQNKLDGCEREQEVKKELNKQYPEKEGYSVVPEQYLRDKDGNIVKDSVTGKARRIDFVVIKDGKVVDMIEVTSKTADKTEQTAKEQRIRDNGGNYVKDADGNLVKIPASVQTRIERRD